MPFSRPQALLFDLGGVLVDIDFSRALTAWAAHSSLSVEELKREFGFDFRYQQHERGEISASEYFDHVASVLKLTASREQVATGWNSIFVGEFPETRRMVQSMRALLPCYAFSNTNASHMVTWSKLYPEVVRAFDRIFVSHEMGLRKPERAAFEHICQSIAVKPGSIAFFDDLLENVQAASDAGLQAILVRSSDDVRDALEHFGFAL